MSLEFQEPNQPPEAHDKRNRKRKQNADQGIRNANCVKKAKGASKNAHSRAGPDDLENVAGVVDPAEDAPEELHELLEEADDHSDGYPVDEELENDECDAGDETQSKDDEESDENIVAH